MTSNASRHFQNALFFLSWMNVRWEAESASPSWNVIIVMKYCRTMPSTFQRTIHASCHYYINHFIRMANDSVTKTFRRSIFPIRFFFGCYKTNTQKKSSSASASANKKELLSDELQLQLWWWHTSHRKTTATINNDAFVAEDSLNNCWRLKKWLTKETSTPASNKTPMSSDWSNDFNRTKYARDSLLLLSYSRFKGAITFWIFTFIKVSTPFINGHSQVWERSWFCALIIFWLKTKLAIESRVSRSALFVRMRQEFLFEQERNINLVICLHFISNFAQDLTYPSWCILTKNYFNLPLLFSAAQF